MGLLDSVIGSVTGSSGSSGSMSPLSKALLAMLAAKAASSYFGGGSAAAAPAHPAPAPAPSGRIESGVLAGMPSLGSILDHFRSSGHADKVESWVGTGPNKPIQATELETALGPDAIKHLQTESGLPRDELLRQLSTAFPQVVDKLTPHGRLPSKDEHARW